MNHENNLNVVESDILESEEEGELDTWGKVHCTQCDAAIAFFPPDVLVHMDNELELYCWNCATGLSSGKH